MSKDYLIYFEVIAHSIGIATAGHRMKHVIKKNTTYPCKGKLTFTTYTDHACRHHFEIFQGESLSTKENTKIGEFELLLVTPLPAGVPIIEIFFIVDIDGILKIEAKELFINGVKNLKVNRIY